MNCKLLFIIFLLIPALFANAQEYDNPASAEAIASAGQSVVLPNAFSGIGNPALMPMMKKTSGGIAISNHYFLSELNFGGAGLVHRFTQTDAAGLVIQYDGTRNFRQTVVAAAYAKALHPRFNAGLSFQWLNMFQQGIGNYNHWLAKAGFSYQVDKRLLIGVSVYNPFTSKLVQLTGERIPTHFSAGACYTVSPQVVFYAEDRMRLSGRHNLKLALHYSPVKNFTFMAGFQNANTPLSFGFRFKTKNILISIAAHYHQVLGLSPAMGLGYESE